MAASASLTPRTPPGKLAEGTAQVWWARSEDASQDQIALLDEAERARLAAYRRAADQDRFLVGCALAKTVIAACTASRPEMISFDRTCRRCGRPHGKPVVAGGPEFSVAHSGVLIAVAMAGDPVGVDVEQLDGRARPLGGDGDPGALARLVLAEPERAALAEADPSARARAFLVAWARKEAVTIPATPQHNVSASRLSLFPVIPIRLIFLPATSKGIIGPSERKYGAILA